MSFFGLVVVGIVALNLFERGRRIRAARAEVRALMGEFEDALAGIRKVQDAHPEDAIDHVGDDYSRLFEVSLVLGRRGSAAIEAIPLLSRAARGSKERDGVLERMVRLWAGFALARISPETASELLPWVAQVLRESTEKLYGLLDRELSENERAEYERELDITFWGLHIPMAMPAHAAPAAPVLIDIMQGPELRTIDGENALVSYLADRALIRMGKPAVPALVAALSHEDPEARGKAVGILAEIGPDAEEAVPALSSLLDDENPAVHRGAIYALYYILKPSGKAEPLLRRSLKSPHKEVRRAATRLLEQHQAGYR